MYDNGGGNNSDSTNTDHKPPRPELRPPSRPRRSNTNTPTSAGGGSSYHHRPRTSSTPANKFHTIERSQVRKVGRKRTFTYYLYFWGFFFQRVSSAGVSGSKRSSRGFSTISSASSQQQIPSSSANKRRGGGGMRHFSDSDRSYRSRSMSRSSVDLQGAGQQVITQYFVLKTIGE